jgi:hypothetical protein
VPIPKERWVLIPGFEIYEVSTQGRVRNRYTGKLCKITPNDPPRDLRGRVGLTTDGKQRTMTVARLMLTAFVRPPVPGELARHLDDDQTNETLDNLAWGFHEDNTEDARRNGKYVGNGGYWKARKQSPEHVEARAEALRGMERTPEWRASISAAKMGHEVSQETRDNIAAALTGRTLSEEHKAAIGKGGKGKPKSAETRARMKEAAARRGPDHYAKSVAARRANGSWNTPEQTAALVERNQTVLREVNTGRPVSVETKDKIRAAHRARTAAAQGSLPFDD